MVKDSVHPCEESRLARFRSGKSASTSARRAVTFLVTVTVTLALAAAAQATPSRAIDTVLTGTVTETGGWCCGSFWTFEGKAVIPSIGKVSVTGTYTAGQIDVFDVQLHEVRALVLTLTTLNGSTLVLTSRLEWIVGDPAPPLVWSVSQATGRFDGYSGTGVYTTTAPATTVGISLSGELSA
jgi:hypothetical protein